VSVVRINVLEVPDGMGEVLEQRFAQRAGDVERTPGFESFELLRPTDGSNRYFVYTRWASEQAFEDWMGSRAFEQGHAKGGPTPAGGPGGGGPVAAGNELLAFDVVIAASAVAASPADEEE
jgi:heme oxygenase (mycobilin-producing)